jgi:hypothetical protein
MIHVLLLLEGNLLWSLCNAVLFFYDLQLSELFNNLIAWLFEEQRCIIYIAECLLFLSYLLDRKKIKLLEW